MKNGIVTTLMMPVELKAKVAAKAAERNVSMAHVTRRLLEMWINDEVDFEMPAPEKLPELVIRLEELVNGIYAHVSRTES